MILLADYWLILLRMETIDVYIYIWYLLKGPCRVIDSILAVFPLSIMRLRHVSGLNR